MNVLKLSRDPYTSEQIVNHLQALRKNALVESSHFAVASILEFKLEDGSYAYVSGVNVEHAEHNRLGMHAEQNAIVAAETLLGGNIKFSKAWVMGAPDFIEAGSEHALAKNFITPCGHCRQILLSFSTPESELYSVTVNGDVSPLEPLSTLLPKAFSERDLETPDTASKSASRHGMFSEPPRLLPHRLMGIAIEMDDDKIRNACKSIKPHVINPAFKTSGIQACMIKVETPDAYQYFTGALVQDIAFLTTDPVFAAVGQMITELGAKHAKIQEVHLYGTSLSPEQLSGSDLQHIARFSTPDTILKFHTVAESSRRYRVEDCFDSVVVKLMEDMASRSECERTRCGMK